METNKRIWNIDKLYQKKINTKNKGKILVIAGPSGVGKSTCAEYIQSTYNYKVINLYTTRKKRENVMEQNVISISKDEFMRKKLFDLFFLSRIGIEPFYGYCKEDLEEIYKMNKCPIFMFRNHGIEFLADTVYNMEVIFITGNATEIALNSHSVTPKFSKTDLQKVIIDNIKIKKKLDYKGIKNYTLKNCYDNNFFAEIKKLELFGENL